MSISKKPTILLKPESIIRKGGEVAESIESNKYLYKHINLPIHKTIIEEIDGLLTKRTVRTSRTYWIQEAIQEKLERELSNTKN